MSNDTKAAGDSRPNAGLKQVTLPGEVVIGSLTSIDESGRPLVSYPGHGPDKPTVALTTISLKKNHIGRQLALLFAQGKTEQPVIIGLIQNPLDDILSSQAVAQTGDGVQHGGLEIEDLHVDGERVVIKGKREIVLKCGDASITLTKSGKIMIRGKYLLSRASGVNRILGGSVQVN